MEIVDPMSSRPDSSGMRLSFSPGDLWEITNAKYPSDGSERNSSHLSIPIFDHTTRQNTNTSDGFYSPTPTPSRLSAEGLIPITDSTSSVPSWSAVYGETEVFQRLGCFTRSIKDFLIAPDTRSLLTVYKSPDCRTFRFQLTIQEKKQEQSFELNCDAHELVIAYADPSAQEPFTDKMIYIQKTSESREVSDYMKKVPLSDRSAIKLVCRFDSMEDITDFQAALLGESLNLAVSRVSSVSYSQVGSIDKASIHRDHEGCGLQIWHEVPRIPFPPMTAYPDLSSVTPPHIINGTILMQPPVEQSRPRLARVVVFRPREEEYLFFYITHDIELIETGNEHRLTVLIRPRKAPSLLILRGRRNKTSSFFKLWRVARSSRAAAGFPLHAPAPDPESDESYQRCEDLKIHFERIQEYRDFIDIWNQAMCFRHKEKKVLQEMERRMSQERYTGKDAVRIRF
ncbi:hypothetical protein QBC38DRAFT_521367 [Podospora fimiseda]|uniref:Uncharacterized protein n=1 Tax=Podospora fimiseda TaxID=252190 RepID=A0AAN6YSH4_9PEZI|nr:hypothetical protein QBC38DRAFT_521367 [Podospora fimiseda]